ncbi:MAG: NAD-binding protein [Anaerolineaceae bacterium]|nr:NAD-binding protein [Anaerolineaceae bacterium]
MKEKISFKDRIEYAVDNTFSRGTTALILWLGVASLVVILMAAALITITHTYPEGEQPIGFLEAAWRSLMRTLDAGTMGGDAGWGFRMIMFGVTLGGVFIISTLIGVLTSGVEGKLDELRKGHSRVIENGHTVILGWSEQIFTIISELVLANMNQSKACIVVLGNVDKVEMEDEIRLRFGNTGTTRVVCRTGNTMEMEDLKLVSLNSSKSIIVLSPDADNPDSEVIKTVLAITNLHGRRLEPFHIVAELRDPKNNEVAVLVGKDEVEWIQVGNMVARIIAQTCRQSGLSVVYTELLDFSGDEIYFYEKDTLTGTTYGETLNLFESNTVMGLAHIDSTACINPPMDTVIKPGDKLILIAEDDDRIILDGRQGLIQAELFAKHHTHQQAPEKTLILGWNWRGQAIIHELENYIASGSILRIVADSDQMEMDVDKIKREVKKQKLQVQRGDITDRATLENLNLALYDHIILLSYSNQMTAQQADAITLIALLHLRDIADRSGINMAITSEMLDVRNRNLAEVTRADDFIVSDRIVSLMLTQVSENKGLNAVFADIFDSEGSEIYLKPVGQYINIKEPVDFYTIVAAARQRGETAIGYRIFKFSRDAERSYGVKLNPSKSERIVFSKEDHLIVLAE